MKYNIRKIRIALVHILLTAVFCQGCGMFASAIPELTEEQTGLVSEYAAETLLSYDKNHGDKLGKEPVGFVDPSTIVVETPTPTPSPTPYVEEDVAESTLGSTEVIDKTVTSSIYSELEDVLKLSADVDFTYDGYEIVDYYPDNTDAYFVMSASEGCDFAIIKFRVSNVTEHTVYLNIPDQSARFKVKLNGNTKNALTTLLLNDLISYREDLEPGESDDVVIVAEFPKEGLANINGLSLIIKTDEGASEIILN